MVLLGSTHSLTLVLFGLLGLAKVDDLADVNSMPPSCVPEVLEGSVRLPNSGIICNNIGYGADTEISRLRKCTPARNPIGGNSQPWYKLNA
jgi:hypothetical protein